jgi:hypothetical protein
MSRPDEVNPERAPAHGPDAYELVYCGERKNHTHLRAVEDGRPCCKPYFKLSNQSMLSPVSGAKPGTPTCPNCLPLITWYQER